MTATRGPYDKAAGILTLILAGLILITMIFLASIVGPVSSAAHAKPQDPSVVQSVGFTAQMLILVIAALLLEAALAVVAGIGILRGAKWGFALGVILYGLLVLAANVVVVIGLAGVAFCVVRLTNGLGPRQTLAPRNLGSPEEADTVEYDEGP